MKISIHYSQVTLKVTLKHNHMCNLILYWNKWISFVNRGLKTTVTNRRTPKGP